MFDTVLIANRGEIARRVIRTLEAMGVRAVAVYSDADRHAPHVREADAAVRLGPPPVGESYLNIPAVLAACRETGAQAVHPGYGFLSESVAFAEALAAEGIAFIGPRPEHLRRFGLKHEARAAAEAAGVPLLPGSGLLADLDAAKTAAADIGYPVMLKSTAGGGGIGLRLCRDEAELVREFEVVRRLGQGNFGDAGVFLEKFVETARHLEVQIFGDGKGRVVALGERDCSLQRRNQKLVEEAPAPTLPEATRAALPAAAVALGESVAYESAGTVEFIYDADADRFHFLEVNTRLQVEHGVTESIFGVDLVDWMVRQAAGQVLPLDVPTPQGHAIEVRLNAEDPARAFRPSAGRLTHVVFPDDARVDGWVETGTEVSAFYDNLLAKLIVTGPDRPSTIAALRDALARTELAGLETNADYLAQVVATDWFAAGEVATKRLGTFQARARIVEVLAPGAQTTVQDWPGRLGHWDVGVPPSGPMDALSFRLANRLLGNPEGAPALECAMMGPTLRFHTDTVIALGGAAMRATLDGRSVPLWAPVAVSAGQTLALGTVDGPGSRCYLAVRGGFDVPAYLGSRSAFTLGRFGGHATGAVQTGDALRINVDAEAGPTATLPEALKPALTHDWTLGVLYGPHGAPDFFTDADIETLFDTAYEVHFNSARTGVRLIGPKPAWARPDGGEAGLHPSNIHDNAYAVGALDFTGDMPIILGPDGPSLGGFVCPVTVALAEMWKVGQLKPGDRVRFQPLTTAEAEARRAAQDRAIANLTPPPAAPAVHGPDDRRDAVMRRGRTGETDMVYRRGGDDTILVEFGPPKLDLTLRFQAHALMERVQAERLPGLIDLTPGIRSLQVHFDAAETSPARVLDVLANLEAELPAVDDIRVPSRTVHLPLSWDDESTREAIRKYQSGVNPDAPWCPSNIEFIRRINGLTDEQAVKDIVFGANYMVLGLGDVYLGAPVATPVDPRHRLVTTKYNPARTWTPENAVGIGGAYLCIYGMEGPGGYQFVGRTIQVWNTWRTTPYFRDGTPWLLRFFDRIKFFPVSAEDLAEARDAFPHGSYDIRVEDGTFDLAAQRRFEAENADSIAAFQAHRQAAFDEERRRWEEAGLNVVSPAEADAPSPTDGLRLPENGLTADAVLHGSVWKLLVDQGARVEAGQPLAILESMKMEVEVTAPGAGVVEDVLVQAGQEVRAGQPLMILLRETGA
ncbi:urea carboxylase [Roseospira navarrensis]|uniref:Urea carboxylase n=1 Tax=Roseospira navarrensis TaxID=140058 RepID=A0A7X1ZFB3_9PROT|nr:urea carboxylase [Roseospira navarrensis]MQX36347.1 urea carboxylase [Roseospira navarrensis]